MSSRGPAPAAATARRNAEEGRSLGTVPDRKREPATGGEDAGEFRGRLLAAAPMQHDDVPNLRIEDP
jgi:hypothetical protein